MGDISEYIWTYLIWQRAKGNKIAYARARRCDILQLCFVSRSQKILTGAPAGEPP